MIPNLDLCNAEFFFVTSKVILFSREKEKEIPQLEKEMEEEKRKSHQNNSFFSYENTVSPDFPKQTFARKCLTIKCWPPLF